jgi:hypothetical protein
VKIDLADFPANARLCVLHWRLFNNPQIKVADNPQTVIAAAAALAALLGPEGKGEATAVHVGRMIHKNEREVRDAFGVLSRLNLWAKKRGQHTSEWWVNVGQLPLFGDAPDRGMVPGLKAPDRGMVPGLKAPDRGMVPGLNDGTIRNSNKSKENDDGKRATGKDAPVSHPDAVSSSSSFLQKEIDGMGAADADEIASLRSLEWVAEWLSVIPYYRKKPIENVPAFLVRAAREGWKPPAIYVNRRNADLIIESRRALEHDELRARRPADPVTVEAERAASVDAMRAAGAELRERFAKRRATA